MNNHTPLPIRSISLFLALFSVVLLACGVSLPSQDQLQGGLATAQAVGQQAAELATGAAPTLEALQTRAVDFATSAAPTVDAGLEQLATAAVRAQDTGGNVQATLEAGGFDGSYLLRKITSLKPNENGQMEIVLTEAEINLILQARFALAVENQAEVVIPAGEVRLTDGVMIFSAQVTNPVEGLLNVTLQPLVTEGQLSFEVISADLNGRPVPPALLSTVETTVNTALLAGINTALALVPGGYAIQSITITDGIMTIIAGKS